MERFENNLETEPRRPEVYFSVSNLVRNCVVESGEGTRKSYEIAILGKTNKDGSKRFQAIGGGAKMTEDAADFLKKKHPDIRFRTGEEHDDARFYIPVPKEIYVSMNGSEQEKDEAQKALDNFGRSVLEKFVDVEGDSNFLKPGDVRREVIDELSKEKVDHVAVLPEEEASTIELEYSSVVSPIEWDNATSGRADGTAGYCRVFYLYDMVVSEAVFEKLKNSPLVRVFSSEDKSAIKEATGHGAAMARLPDGSVVVENIFPDFYGTKS